MEKATNAARASANAQDRGSDGALRDARGFQGAGITHSPLNRPQPESARSSAQEATTATPLPLLEKFRKRGRVDSAHGETSTIYATRNAKTLFFMSSGAARVPAVNRKRTMPRTQSTPNLCAKSDNSAIMNVFFDVNPRDLRIAEVKSWHCTWMDQSFKVASADLDTIDSPVLDSKTADKDTTQMPSAEATTIDPESPSAEANELVELDAVITQITNDFAIEDKVTAVSSMATRPPPIATPPPVKRQDLMHLPSPMTPIMRTPSSKRPQLRLKLEDMPTPQQAEDRAHRAASRLIAKREVMEKAMIEAAASGTPNEASAAEGASATQKAILRLNFKSYSSGEDSETNSPSDAGRHSAGSAYSPNHGMFTTKNVAVSEAGISSPDGNSLHLQENLERVREVGRGASGVVYKAIHIPTLKVVAVKDVSVYGRGQRRQMVRELHALYSNLVPISDTESPQSIEAAWKGTPKPKPSPYIVSFYDAFVDRPKNCMCLVMEYMGTGSLQDIVLRGGCQNEKILARLATGVLKGLAHIHGKRMVHRDIKPHNLLTNRRGEVKISDFGLARTLNDSSTMTKTFVGTLLYMAPERIGGGDYSYPADIWSFGLAIISVALGRYPLPTQDGFFGLVDSVANEKCLELPAEHYSPECCSFVQECLRSDPNERPSAEALLSHPFIKKFSPEDTMKEWSRFIEETSLCEDREQELESLAEAVYRHIYQRCVRFSFQPQSDYGVSFLSQATPTYSRRQVSIEPVQMSLQLGLANYLGLPVHKVYEVFETKRCIYSDKLLEEYCYSPQSWTASPGLARRQQLFGSDIESPNRPNEKSSFWRKIQDGMAKLGSRRKHKNKNQRSGT